MLLKLGSSYPPNLKNLLFSVWECVFQYNNFMRESFLTKIKLIDNLLLPIVKFWCPIFKWLWFNRCDYKFWLKLLPISVNWLWLCRIPNSNQRLWINHRKIKPADRDTLIKYFKREGDSRNCVDPCYNYVVKVIIFTLCVSHYKVFFIYNLD